MGLSRAIVGLLSLAGLVHAGGGCVSDELLESLATPPGRPMELDAGPPRPAPLRLRELSVRDVIDEEGLLELEVHLIDAATGALLGCTGHYQGLLTADVAGVTYLVEAHFVRPNSVRGGPGPWTEWLTHDDVKGRMIVVRVTEDDLNACPEPFGGGDDLLAESAAISGDQLLGQLTRFSFGNVTSLVIGFP